MKSKLALIEFDVNHLRRKYSNLSDEVFYDIYYRGMQNGINEGKRSAHKKGVTASKALAEQTFAKFERSVERAEGAPNGGPLTSMTPRDFAGKAFTEFWNTDPLDPVDSKGKCKLRMPKSAKTLLKYQTRLVEKRKNLRVFR